MKNKNLIKVLGIALCLMLSPFINAQSDISRPDKDVLVIFDTSGSMEEIYKVGNKETTKIDYARAQFGNMLRKFSSNPMGQNVGVITFNNGPVLSRDLEPLKNSQEISQLVKGATGGVTPLAESIRYAADILSSSSSRYKSLIILSDGQDDEGIGAVISAIQYFNQKLNANVQVNLFALAPESFVWAQFKDLRDVIIHGTLYLVASGQTDGYYDPIFDLTYNSISGEWPQSRLNTRIKEIVRDRPNLHADHVHIIDGGPVRAYRNHSPSKNKDKGITVDWEEMKKNNPELYQEYEKGLLSLENHFALNRGQLSYLHALSTNVKSYYEGDRPSLEEIYWHTLEKTPGLFDEDSSSLPASATSAYAFFKLARAVGIELGPEDHWKKIGEVTLASTSAMVLGGSGVVSLGGPIFGRQFAIVGSNASFIGGVSSFVGAANGSDNLELSQEQLQSLREKEVSRHKKFLGLEKAKASLQILFPNLSEDELRGKARRLMEPELTLQQRLEIMFSHSESYDALETSILELSSFMGTLEENELPQETIKGMREGELPPRHIEAYLGALERELKTLEDTLKSDLEKARNSDDFSPEIKKFLEIAYENANNSRKSFNKRTKSYLKNF